MDDTLSDTEQLALSAKKTNGLARVEALSLIALDSTTSATMVTYRSDGNVLVCSDKLPDKDLIEKLSDRDISATYLLQNSKLPDASVGSLGTQSTMLEGKVAGVSGYFGAFQIALDHTGGTVDAARLAGVPKGAFDLILDLCSQKLLIREVLPVGYFAPASSQELEMALNELVEMTGEFDKPKFFSLNPDICAHTSRGVTGCTRCLDVCPTGAIESAEESVTVDPYLCQGIGVCTTVCPTGAISYVFPQVGDMLDNLRQALHRYHDNKGKKPALIFYDDESGRSWMQDVAKELPENLIPVSVENMASVGMDIWMSALAYGAHYVILLATDETTDEVAQAITREIDVADAILSAIGYASQRIVLIRPESPAQILKLIPKSFGKPLAPAAGFAGFNEKRTTLRLALDHFVENAPKIRKSVSLAPGSPFGRVQVDRDACTLCMSCVAVCPAAALTNSSGLPRLMFLERNCVQCGMCEKACPEDAISLDSRYHFESEVTDRVKVLHEEEPFNCVKCGTPFATQSMMARMREKLKNHWMYQDNAQMQRLEMCENCRIEDMYAGSGGLDPYEKENKPTGSKV